MRIGHRRPLVGTFGDTAVSADSSIVNTLFLDIAPQPVDVDGTLLTVDVVEVGAELIGQRCAHSCTPRELRSRASPRSAWFCAVDFVVPNNSATSLNVHS